MWLAVPAAANDPLSAIDWLEDAPERRAPVAVAPQAPAVVDEPEATKDARVPGVEVVPLDAPSGAGVGLLPSKVTGFPNSLWQASDAQTVGDLMGALPAQHGLPAVQSLVLSLILAEAEPPKGDADGFLAARINALVARGAVGPADQMLALLAPLPPALVAQAADVALLQGDTTALCERIAAQPSVSNDTALTIYCLAQAGQWAIAVTTLEAGRALGDLSAEEHGLLVRFLDPELAEELPALAPPSASAIRPLEYRLLAAAGEPLPTSRLPLAYAQSDLSGDTGWKSRLEAAERLVRAGAIGEAQLFAAYTERVPAASGGIWDRAEAIQKFDIALRARDPGALTQHLARVWPMMKREGLGVAFGKHYAPSLAQVPLTGVGAQAQFEALMLSPQYERHAATLSGNTPAKAFALSIATGQPEDPPNAQATAIAAAWQPTATPPPALVRATEDGRIGEAILRAASLLATGAEGDLRALTDGLIALRHLGLEDPARRAALQVHLGGDTRR